MALNLHLSTDHAGASAPPRPDRLTDLTSELYLDGVIGEHSRGRPLTWVDIAKQRQLQDLTEAAGLVDTGREPWREMLIREHRASWESAVASGNDASLEHLMLAYTLDTPGFEVLRGSHYDPRTVD